MVTQFFCNQLYTAAYVSCKKKLFSYESHFFRIHIHQQRRVDCYILVGKRVDLFRYIKEMCKMNMLANTKIASTID